MKKKKRKLNWKACLILLLVIYLIGIVTYYFFTMPVKNIVIKGNEHIKNNEIINNLKIEKGMPLAKISSKKIKKSLLKESIISDDEINLYNKWLEKFICILTKE